MDHVFYEMNYFHPSCAVLFDGPVGEQAPPGKLGELGKEESHPKVARDNQSGSREGREDV